MERLGTEVIAENMKRGGEINPMIPGRKVVAIFGFWDIRQFTDSTEVLQEEVMEYVNTIGKIAHGGALTRRQREQKYRRRCFLLVEVSSEYNTRRRVSERRTVEGRREVVCFGANR